ncbi:hypothetical protein M8J76_001656 [Diaphorina citri]|nr:hypothetical protein M8J75_016431 [Diaphorina citri]KAI5744360.1 hypothetical protein M8J76_001656 [Diaphorina citri]
MFACYHGREDVVAYLVQAGADRLITDGRGQTALLLAASSNNLAILKAVYDERIVNAEDENGWTPLYHAVNVGFEPGIHYLLQHKANINHRRSSLVSLLQLETPASDCLAKLLHELNLDKYYTVFQRQRIGLRDFARMNENDLKNAGITLLGPRRKMYLAICKLKGEEYKKQS